MNYIIWRNVEIFKKYLCREWSVGKENRESFGFRARISILNMESSKPIDYSTAALKLPLYHGTSIPNRTRRWHGGDIVTVAWNLTPKRTPQQLEEHISPRRKLKAPCISQGNCTKSRYTFRWHLPGRQGAFVLPGPERLQEQTEIAS